MPTLRRRFYRASNFVKRQVGLPAYWLTHHDLHVSMVDNRYLVKSSLLNLTGKRLTVFAEAVAYDKVGYVTFDNASFLTLLSSGQMLGFSGSARHPDYKRGIVVQPYDEVDIEILDIARPDGSLAMFHTHGYSTLPKTGACTLAIKIAGHGKPHRFFVNIEYSSDGKVVHVRQSSSFRGQGKRLELPMHDECSKDDVYLDDQEDLSYGTPVVPGLPEIRPNRFSDIVTQS